MLKTFSSLLFLIFTHLLYSQHLELVEHSEETNCQHDYRISVADGGYFNLAIEAPNQLDNIYYANSKKSGNQIVNTLNFNEIKVNSIKGKGERFVHCLLPSGNDVMALFSIIDNKTNTVNVFKLILNKSLKIVSEQLLVSKPVASKVENKIPELAYSKNQKHHLLIFQSEFRKCPLVSFDDQLNPTELNPLELHEEINVEYAPSLYIARMNDYLFEIREDAILLEYSAARMGIYHLESGTSYDISYEDLGITGNYCFKFIADHKGNIVMYGVNEVKSESFAFLIEMDTKGKIIRNISGDKIPDYTSGYSKLMKDQYKVNMSIYDDLRTDEYRFHIGELHTYSDNEFVFPVRVYSLVFHRSQDVYNRISYNQAAILCHVKDKSLTEIVVPFIAFIEDKNDFPNRYNNNFDAVTKKAEYIDKWGKKEIMTFYNDDYQVAWIVYELKEHYTDKGVFKPESSKLRPVSFGKYAPSLILFDLKTGSVIKKSLAIKSNVDFEVELDQMHLSQTGCNPEQNAIVCRKFGLSSLSYQSCIAIFRFD